ncbi:N-acetylmuramoyl-L-alanine amidase [Patescibacteria group bacterium]|nr:N-acetylmuramoyl-L-alanine amidase [Patescibacteria group bacterium]
MKKLFISSILLVLITAMGIGQPAMQKSIPLSQTLTLKSLQTASEDPMEPAFEKETVYTSEVFESDFPFELLALNYKKMLPEQTDASLQIRFRLISGEWTDWEDLTPDDDLKDTDTDKEQSFVITEKANAFQYQAYLQTDDESFTPVISDLSVDYINGGQPSVLSKLARLTFSNEDGVISREQWGADENLRLAKYYSVPEDSGQNDKESPSANTDPDLQIVRVIDKDGNGNNLLWPLEFSKEVKKIVIHHTATNGDLSDPKAAIRAIYQYHAVTRGWGDIGYNFIIDQDGNIYKGRYGGDGVVAGHAYGYNEGTIGIALLGNFENDQIPPAMMQSLMALIYDKANLNGIDIDASGAYKGKVIPNLVGHRDLAATACPGENAYDYLPEIRAIVGESQDNRRHLNNRDDFSYEEVGDRELLTLSPNEIASVTIKIKNTGSKSWDSSTFLTVNADTEAEKSLTVAKDEQKSVARMKESTVTPGQTATFTFQVKGNTTGGLVNLDMTPIFNGTEKTTHYMDLGAYVTNPLLKYSVASTQVSSGVLKPGESTKVIIKLKNTSTLTWNNSGTNKVTLRDSGDSALVSSSTLATLKETEVKPGGTGTFEFTIKAPSSGGTYTLYFAPDMSGAGAITTSSGRLSIEVVGGTQDANIIGASTDLNFKPGENKAVYLQIQNSSRTTWTKTNFDVSVTKPSSVSMTTPKLSVLSLAPGRSAKIFFSITAPETAGEYTISLRPRLNKQNLTSSSYALTFTVENGSTTPISQEYENPIRIKLTPNEQTTPVLSSNTAFSIYDNQTLLKTFPAQSRIRITRDGSNFILSSGLYRSTATGPLRFVPAQDGYMKILTMDQRPAWDTSLNDNSFRGTMEIRYTNNQFLFINELGLEDYLKEIAEVSNSDPTEKIKTIQVLARTYAWYYMTHAEKFPGQPYDLDDDPLTSQKYLGYGYESRSPNAVTALSQTEGEVVTYNGKVVKTPYFSQSDGTTTRSAKEVWGWTDTPWLVSVDDSLCTATSFAGHGVGLSGCGATQMALQGKSHEQIIKYYFTGVQLGEI